VTITVHGIPIFAPYNCTYSNRKIVSVPPVAAGHSVGDHVFGLHLCSLPLFHFPYSNALCNRIDTHIYTHSLSRLPPHTTVDPLSSRHQFINLTLSLVRRLSPRLQLIDLLSSSPVATYFGAFMQSGMLFITFVYPVAS
jgi:hypothetical protein